MSGLMGATGFEPGRWGRVGSQTASGRSVGWTGAGSVVEPVR